MLESQISHLCSVIIPAHNEASVIDATLAAIAAGQCADIEIIVIANGCKDKTAERAKAHKGVTVMDIPQGNKTAALNLGVTAASSEILVFLDADIRTNIWAVRTLARALSCGENRMAYGNASFQTRSCHWTVRAFYRAWMLNPYFDHHKVGGFFALTREAFTMMGGFPDLTNDDEYVRRHMLGRSVFMAHAPYEVKAPKTLSSLIAVRSRVYRGNDELGRRVEGYARHRRWKKALIFACRLLMRPTVWPGMGVFLWVALRARLNVWIQRNPSWGQDLSNRPVKDEG